MTFSRSWPAVGTERLPWVSRVDPTAMSRRARARAEVDAYEAALPPLIAHLRYAPASGLASDLEDAAAQAARYDAEVGAELAPYLGVLLRSESAASSTIEHLSASARAIAAAEVGVDRRTNARVVAANTSAMRRALATEGPVTAESVLAMHAALLHADPVHEAGRWREEPVWIGGSGYSPAGAAYVAPHHERVPGLVHDLVAYLRTPDVPVLQQVAVGHAQFETIHPFTDGNGRTGRALVHAQLRATGLVRRATVPLSAAILTGGDAYVTALTAYRQGDPDPVLQLFADATVLAVARGRRLAGQITAVREGWREVVTARPQSRVWEILDLLVRQPVLTAATLHEELGIAPGHVRRHMDRLVESGVVVEARVHRTKGTYWRAPEVLAALDSFAEASGRRSALTTP